MFFYGDVANGLQPTVMIFGSVEIFISWVGKREEDEAGTCQGFFSFLFFGCVDGYSRVTSTDDFSHKLIFFCTNPKTLVCIISLPG
jgi:hypothetical protein